MTTKTFDLDHGISEVILDWAQTQLDSMPADEYGGDWWGAYDESWDVNIYDHESYIHVTVYPIITVADTRETNFTQYNRIGSIDMALRNYIGESCALCGKRMDGKYESTTPVRTMEHGVICGECAHG
jgi:hypothetical protein